MGVVGNLDEALFGEQGWPLDEVCNARFRRAKQIGKAGCGRDRRSCKMTGNQPPTAAVGRD